MSLYPRLLWSPEGVEVTAGDATAEADYLSQGYRKTAEPVAESEPGPAPLAAGEVPDDAPEGPTFGPPHDATHAKRGGKKK